MTATCPDPKTTINSRWDILGFHIAFVWNDAVRGMAVWPRGRWPKRPWLYRFYQSGSTWKLMECCK